MDIGQINNFTSQQLKWLDMFTELIKYDKEQAATGKPPENTRLLEAFIDTQRRALEVTGKLIEKHKPALEAQAKKKQAEAAFKSKEQAVQTKIKQNYKEAVTDESSLFAEAKIEENADSIDDGYSFEETDCEE